MPLRDEVLAELDRLIEEGNTVLGTYPQQWGRNFASTLPESRVAAFRTSAAAAIERTAGSGSEYYAHLPPIVSPGKLRNFRENIDGVVGVLVALRDAVDHGLLVRLEQRVRSNTYDDFLAQAEELLKVKPSYPVAAMVLVGGVLEDQLRKMCLARDIKWKGRDGLAAYNEALKELAYPQAIWRRVQVVGDNRNDAAHGGEDAAKLKHADVEDDLRWVRKFMAEHVD